MQYVHSTVWVQLPVIKVKGKLHTRASHDDPDVEYRISSTLYVTLTVDGGGGQRPTPAVFPPSKKQDTYFTLGISAPESALLPVTQLYIPKQWNPR